MFDYAYLPGHKLRRVRGLMDRVLATHPANHGELLKRMRYKRRTGKEKESGLATENLALYHGRRRCGKTIYHPHGIGAGDADNAAGRQEPSSVWTKLGDLPNLPLKCLDSDDETGSTSSADGLPSQRTMLVAYPVQLPPVPEVQVEPPEEIEPGNLEDIWNDFINPDAYDHQ